MSAVGESKWVEALYDERAAGLLLYGRALGLAHGEAEDVLQETFRALLALEAPPDEPAHYLVRSYRNRALNHRRGWWRRVTRELEAHRWFELAEPTDPREERVVEALAELPAEQREVIVLKIWQRLTFAAIGHALGHSPNTIAGRYRYGLQRLRRRLETPDTQADGSPHELTEIASDATSLVAAASPLARS